MILQPSPYAAAMAKLLAQRIHSIRTRLGKNQTEFGELFPVSQSTVTRWEKGSQPEPNHLFRIAELGGTTVDELLGSVESDGPGGRVAVVGFVGAGAEVLPYDDYSHGDGMGFIDRPAFITGRAVAVEVRGDSLFPVAENGWKLVYTGEQTVIEDEVLNKLCIVKLEDGRMLVKRLTRGSKPHHYHLASTNAPTIEDVRIEWAAKVRAIVPD